MFLGDVVLPVVNPDYPSPSLLRLVQNRPYPFFPRWASSASDLSVWTCRIRIIG